MTVNLQKKISIARVFGKMNAAVIAAFATKNPGQAMPVMRIIGIANGTKEGTSDYGDWTALVGQFRATNAATGEVMDSAQAFLPDVAQGIIEAQLKGGALAVEFAFDIKARLDENSPVGFSYTASPLMQASAENPLLKLAAAIDASAPLALAAPVPSATPATQAPAATAVPETVTAPAGKKGGK